MSVIAILGMHRSGTSCLAGSLEQYGLHLGDIFTWNPYNLKGNREDKMIMQLNDSVLSFNNGNWENPPVNIRWTQEQVNERNRIIHTLTTGHPTSGFKDPRTLLTLPFWLSGFPSMKFVGTFRHPLYVANSLHSRDKMRLQKALDLWLEYNSRLLSYIDEFGIPLISFDVKPEEYLSSIKRIAEAFNLQSTVESSATPFFQSGLRNSNHLNSNHSIPNAVRDLFEILNRRCREQACS